MRRSRINYFEFSRRHPTRESRETGDTRRGFPHWFIFLVLPIFAFSPLACRQGPEPPAVPAGKGNPVMEAKMAAARKDLDKAPGSADAWGRYGETLHASEYLDDARFCYKQAAKLAPASARWRHLLGLVQLEGDPASAIANLRLAAEFCEATNDSPSLRLAQALVERGEFPEATNRLYKLLAAKPNHAAARLELARIALSSGDWRSAESWLGPCRTNPYTARSALLLLSQARARAGDAASATDLGRRAESMPRGFDWPDPYLREVQALRDDPSKLADRVSDLLQKRRLDEAEIAVSNLLTRYPGDPEGILLQGRLRLQQRRCLEAEQQCRAYLDRIPNGLSGLIQLALAQMCQEHWNDAAYTLTRAVVIKPDFAQAHYNLGSVRLRLGENAKAVESFREAVRCNPGDAAAYSALAEAQAAAGQAGDAVESANRALQLDPSNVRARNVKERAAGRGR